MQFCFPGQSSGCSAGNHTFVRVLLEHLDWSLLYRYVLPAMVEFKDPFTMFAFKPVCVKGHAPYVAPHERYSHSYTLFIYPLSNKPIPRQCRHTSRVVKMLAQVVADHMRGGRVALMGSGLWVPARFSCWASLAVTQMLVPQASLTGHLCGVIAGLAHVYIPKAGIACAFALI